MLSVYIITVGKLKESYIQKAVDEYSKRLSSFCKFQILELPEEKQKSDHCSEIQRVIDCEGKRILEKLPSGCIAISTCIEGHQMTSVDFSKMINDYTVDGNSKIAFIIGGSNGLSAEVKKRSEKLLSFSKMTFPHQLFRVMLCEQIYRAFSIQKGTKYHK